MGVYWGTKRHSWLSYVSFWLSISFLSFLIEVFILKTLSNSSVQIVKYFYFILVPVNILLSLKLLFKKNEKKALPIFSFYCIVIIYNLNNSISISHRKFFKKGDINHSSFICGGLATKGKMNYELIK